MKRSMTFLHLVVLLLIPLMAHATQTDSAEKELLPVLELEVPENEFYRSYLGLQGGTGEKFVLSEIDADILVIELFSMYCPYCQKEAPVVNELYEKMSEYKSIGLNIKIIGLGASNSQFEVEHFRDTYNVPFPLFPDKDMTLYKALKGAGTPGFVGVHLGGDDTAVIVLRNSGGFYSADDFLKELVKNSGY